MKNRPRRATEENVALWRAHVAAWQKSGLSQSRYSREHGIRQSSLSYWILRLNVALPATSRPNIVEISPATIVQALRPEQAPAPLTLCIAGRYQLQIRGDFAAHVLEKVVRTLEGL